MKRLMLFLMVCCLIGLMQADLAVTNGDFADESLGALDIVGWWDLDTINTNQWWDTASNTQGPEPFPTNSGFLGDTWPSDGGGRWMYQQIGTKEENTGYTLSFQYAQPTDGGTGRSVSIQVDIYQGDFAEPAQDVDIADQELTLIDSFTAPFESEMVIFDFSAELDLSSANMTDPLWLRLSNPPGQGTGGATDAWVCVDNVEIISQTLSFVYDSPLNEEIKVPVEVASEDNDLTWTIVDPNIVEVDLYFGLENDPNLTLDPEGQGYQRIDGMEVELGQYSWSPPYQLEYLTDYYWKVVGWEPNEFGTLDPVPGQVWTFRTINDEPEVSAVDPVVLSVPAGDDAELTVIGELVNDYTWYKVVGEQDSDENGETDDEELTDDDVNYSIERITDEDGDRSVLTVLDVQESAGDEGYFYCVGTNTAGEDTSELGRAMEQRLTSYWPLDTDYELVSDPNTFQLDTEDGYHMLLASEVVPGGDTGLDYPVLDANVVSSVVGDESLWFRNSNENDPNSFWGQYALVKPGVAEFGDITISCWYYWEGGGDWQWILGFGNDSRSENYMFLTPNSGAGTIRFAIGREFNEDIIDADMVPGGRWTHLTVTLEGDTARIYVNGELESTDEEFTNNPYIVDMNVNYIATSIYPDPYFNGLIDDLKIYNYARTTEQIALDYLAVRGEYVCNNQNEALVYDFNDDCHTNLVDFSMFATEWLGSNRIYPAE